MSEQKENQRCEVCEGKPTHLCCSLDQPMLWFCEEHYWEHVDACHNGNQIAWPPYPRRKDYRNEPVATPA